MLTSLTRHWQDEGGVATVEYALLVALVAVAGIAAWDQLAETVGGMLLDTSNNIANGS